MRRAGREVRVSAVPTAHNVRMDAPPPCGADEHPTLAFTLEVAPDHRLAVAVRKAIAAAPPLTPEQRDRIVTLLKHV